MIARCSCCGQFVDVADIEAALERVDLSAFQRRIVDTLRKANGAWVPAERLMDVLYGDDIDGGPDGGIAVVRQHIAHLRRKIKGSTVIVECRSGYGYRFIFGDMRPKRTPYSRSSTQQSLPA